MFINRRQVVTIGEWLQAEEHLTVGYAFRPGWHCCIKPSAPHLSGNGRVWMKVEVDDWKIFDRPSHQGGQWVLAQKMKVLEEVV